MKRRQPLLQQEKGFTLIELMAVLAILTMLVLIAVPAIGSITKKAEAQADDATISMIEKAGGLALLGDVAYDDPEEEQYDVTTLVEEGYLDIDESHKYAGAENYVTRIKGYEFEFNGDGDIDEPTDESTPTPEPEKEPIDHINDDLNSSSKWKHENAYGVVGTDSITYPFARLRTATTLPAGDYTITLTMADTLPDLPPGYFRLSWNGFDADNQNAGTPWFGVLYTTKPDVTTVSFNISIATNTVSEVFALTYYDTSETAGGKIMQVPLSWIDEHFTITFAPR